MQASVKMNSVCEGDQGVREQRYSTCCPLLALHNVKTYRRSSRRCSRASRRRDNRHGALIKERNGKTKVPASVRENDT